MNFLKVSYLYNTFQRSASTKPKTGIVMLNMGGPETLEEVPMYLQNIMTDSNMIQLPFQKYLGPLIAKRRTKEVQQKYSEIGGGSPILKWTNIQGNLLCQQLEKNYPQMGPYKHYVAFRYVKPLTEEALSQIELDDVHNVVLLSNYPQYCCATTGSSLIEVYKYYKQKKVTPNQIKFSLIDRWGSHPELIKTIADRINDELKHFGQNCSDVILMFSAHSLPLKNVCRGDSYVSEISSTVHLVMNELNYKYPYIITWQSKVGPVAWLKPFTDEAIEQYSKKGYKNFILIPVAFINEHIETLHELDIEYCEDLGKKLKVNIRRAAAPNDHPNFIKCLADLVQQKLESCSSINPKFLLRCPHCTNPKCGESKRWFSKHFNF